MNITGYLKQLLLYLPLSKYKVYIQYIFELYNLYNDDIYLMIYITTEIIARAVITNRTASQSFKRNIEGDMIQYFLYPSMFPVRSP